MCRRCNDIPAESQETGHGQTSPRFGVKVCLLLIKGYQYCISPFFPPCCRYTPTCSQYVVEAISRYGVVKGLWLGVCRILRCHPFVRGGYDPVK